jgi:hypothetical protein
LNKIAANRTQLRKSKEIIAVPGNHKKANQANGNANIAVRINIAFPLLFFPFCERATGIMRRIVNNVDKIL